MTDEKPLSAEGITKIVERLGLPTIIIVAVSYVGYNEIIAPISAKYVEMVAAVTEANAKLTAVTEEMKVKIVEVGERNGATMQRIEEKLDDLLKQSER